MGAIPQAAAGVSRGHRIHLGDSRLGCPSSEARPEALFKTERLQFSASPFSFPSVSKYAVHAEHSRGERRGDAFELGLDSFGIRDAALRHILASAAAAPGLCHDIFHEGSHVEGLARRLRED